MSVALYARVSTVRQAQADLSIPDQLNRMREWCKQNGLVVAKEYVEPGASATDDKRPVFQQMIDEATKKPHPFEAIIVHSRSRFFRDLYGSLHYGRKLSQVGTRLISITQPTPDDASGEMMVNMISMMDDYSSKENAKHTSRAMMENASRGFFNGSRAPFGYQVVDTDVPGHKGKVRKKLAIDDKEAFIVRKIYGWYLNGLNGHLLGIKKIAQELNEQGLLMRGGLWRSQKIHDVLSDPTYRGEYSYNMRDSKKCIMRPESEWIRCQVEPIVEEKVFDDVRRKREAQDPKKVALGKAVPHALTSPILLTGLLKCSQCNAGMTLATGKSGRYKYYKCCKKMSISPHVCDTPNLPMDRMDKLILERLIEKVLAPDRVTLMIKDWLKHQEKMQGSDDKTVQELTRSLKVTEDGLNNLYSAIEKGIIALDSSLQSRVNQLKDTREKIVTEMALLKRDKPSFRKISPKQVAYATQRMKEILLDTESGYGKQLLNLLVEDIRVDGKQATVRGNYAALDLAVDGMKMGTPIGVPRFVNDWCARRDSNS
ncbi:recombinase family protein [Sulfuriferula nivalis]|uniref:Resolvase n=1 Tax=Sulfuriferula nivalis TaxID=2675298 RepID=A0A809SH71_9PROT|nr:recombinase family protein [Sulfuriferula nivalis]BBP00550.1 resolvase [Sulfuriferula nivalis]